MGQHAKVENWGLENRQGILFIDKVSCLDLVRQFGTPLHVLQEKRLQANIRRFQKAFSGYAPGVHIFYSYKSNGIPGILKLLHGETKGEKKEWIGAEVISPYELWLALKIGVPPHRIIYNGVNKSPESLETALQLKVRVNADSWDELKLIEAKTKESGQIAEIGLRVSPKKGWNSHFGFSLHDNEAYQAVEFLSHSPHIVLKGLMCHLTTRATDAKLHEEACFDLLRFASEIKRGLGITIQSLDLGGGFGVPMVRGFSPLENLLYRLWNRPPRAPREGDSQSIERMAEYIIATLRRGCDQFRIPPPILCLEPGRIITSDAQILLLSILGIKRRGKDRLFTLTDGGRFNINYPLDHEYHTSFVANKLNNIPQRDYFVVGRLCSPGDWVFRQVRLPLLEAGDLLAIMDSGAYFTQFSTNFSYPRAAVVLVQDGHARVLRQRETFEYMIGMDQW